MLGERMNVDRKIAMVAVLAAVAVIAGYVIVTYAQETNNTTSTVTPTTPSTWIPLKGYGVIWRKGFKVQLMHNIEVSPEYNSTVINILKSNSEAQQLLNQGFSIAWIKPVIKAYISGSGDVTLKATQAIVALTNSTSVYVYSVDISNNTVTLLAYYQVQSFTTGCRCPCG
ncbi:MAG: hypothetical protein QXH02_01965 [Desulfurococcaceae archaeon]